MKIICNNESQILQFTTTILCLLESGLSIKESLEIAEGLKTVSKQIREFCREVYNKTQIGISFNMSIKLSETIQFPDKFIAMIGMAEDSGNIKIALKSIVNSIQCKKQSVSRIIRASIYPLIIFIFVLIGSYMLFFQYEIFGFSTLPSEVFSGILSSTLFIVFFLSIFSLYAVLVMKDPLELLVIQRLLFMSEQKFDLYTSLNLSLSYTYSTSESHILFHMKKSISIGTSFYEACKKTNIFSNETLYFLEVGEKECNIEKAFKLIVENLSGKLENRRNTFVQLSEPVLLLGIGVYIMILIQTVVLPFITQNSYYF